MPLSFTSKVLMKHILNSNHSRGRVVNEELLHTVNDHMHYGRGLQNAQGSRLAFGEARALFKKG